jgi:site-specific DNA recombinase
MRTAIYCRISTDDQEKEGTSLQTQREACLAYCQQKGHEVCPAVFRNLLRAYLGTS